MEFKVNSKELEKLLTKIIPAVPTRTPMSILENFLFEIKDGSLTIYATDLEISMKSSINIVSEDNMSLVVPAKLGLREASTTRVEEAIVHTWRSPGRSARRLIARGLERHGIA